MVALALALTVLSGTVGPDFTISLKEHGKPVKSLRAGRYELAVNDRSAIHNFHLKGPGLDRTITGVEFVGRRTVTVRLRKGRYTFFCDPHFAVMRGSFVVS